MPSPYSFVSLACELLKLRAVQISMHATVAMLHLFDDIVRYFTRNQLSSISLRHDIDEIPGGLVSFCSSLGFVR
jgi:hypothetical protein